MTMAGTTTTSELQPLNEMGIFPVADTEISQCVMYICNLAFSDVLDECKNTKFPGGLAVSLSRDMLSRLQGHNGHHLPYTKTDILSWINPVDRIIPPMIGGGNGNGNGGNQHKIDRSKGMAVITSSSSSSSLDILQLDFGSTNGLFEILPVCCICPTDLDFGPSNGLFEISQL